MDLDSPTHSEASAAHSAAFSAAPFSARSSPLGGPLSALGSQDSFRLFAHRRYPTMAAFDVAPTSPVDLDSMPSLLRSSVPRPPSLAGSNRTTTQTQRTLPYVLGGAFRGGQEVLPWRAGSFEQHGLPQESCVLRPTRIVLAGPLGGMLGAFLPRDCSAQLAFSCKASCEDTSTAATSNDEAAPECCAFCLEEFRAGDRVQPMLACRHLFHEDCVRQFLRTHSPCGFLVPSAFALHIRCPMCRGPVGLPRSDSESLAEVPPAERNLMVSVNMAWLSHGGDNNNDDDEDDESPLDVDHRRFNSGGSLDAEGLSHDLGQGRSLPICRVWPRGFYRRAASVLTPPEPPTPPPSPERGRASLLCVRRASTTPLDFILLVE